MVVVQLECWSHIGIAPTHLSDMGHIRTHMESKWIHSQWWATVDTEMMMEKARDIQYLWISSCIWSPPICFLFRFLIAHKRSCNNFGRCHPQFTHNTICTTKPTLPWHTIINERSVVHLMRVGAHKHTQMVDLRVRYIVNGYFKRYVRKGPYTVTFIIHYNRHHTKSHSKTKPSLLYESMKRGAGCRSDLIRWVPPKMSDGWLSSARTNI